MTMMEISEDAVKAEKARDLRSQVAELSDIDQPEVLFRETSPTRKLIRLYSMEDGSPVDVYKYRLDATLAKTVPGTKDPMFTSDPKKAPKWEEGKLKCFLAKGSPEEEMVRQLGLFKSCKAVHIPNEYAREQHALKKHKAEWKAYSDHLAKARYDEDRALQRAQVEAMMALAKEKADK